ncbi:hypothetical protein F5Y18DRAFT_421103 [Xylariaceae sp. FL1019]|nr:hypothetical protein F5Y18DRAFT_421103 [Xylariaceae sp. FL1019]
MAVQDSTTVGGPPKIFCLGLPRTGTESMSQALRILGYEPVHHAVAMITNGWDTSWIQRAAQAHYPGTDPWRGQEAGQEKNARNFTRAEWDEIFGSFSVVTDVSWKFAPSLIAAYPDALVVLTERDVDKWERSVNETIIDRLWPQSLGLQFVSRCYGYLDPDAWDMADGTRATYLGKFGATGPEDLRSKLRAGYATHEKEIKDAVPADRLLCYKIGDGWEPLCEFLGKDVPEMPYPHGNDAGAFERWHKQQRRLKIRKALGKGLSYCTAVGVIGAAVYYGNNLR